MSLRAKNSIQTLLLQEESAYVVTKESNFNKLKLIRRERIVFKTGAHGSACYLIVLGRTRQYDGRLIQRTDLLPDSIDSRRATGVALTRNRRAQKADELS